MWPTNLDIKLGEFDAMELPGQQLTAANAPTPLDHLLNLDIHAPSGCLRLTGIAATMGKSSYDIEIMENLIRSGMNIAILNTNFGTLDEHIAAIHMLRAAIKTYSAEMGRYYPLAIALCLSGRKIRTGHIAQMYGETVELKIGDVVRLTTDEAYRDRCSMYTIFVSFAGFGEQIKKHDVVLLDNELIELKVEMISSGTVTCKIIRGGTLGHYKDVYVQNRAMNMPNFSEKDMKDIDMGIRNRVDIVIASFVTSSSIIAELKQLLGEKGKKISIVANVQTLEGFKNLDEILAATDGIMITRQELGSDINQKRLVLAQKNIISRANRVNVPVIVSAQVLSSMRHNNIPLRSELLDVGNIVLDGADVLCLSAETAIGYYPVESIKVLNASCKEAEACIWSKQTFYDLIDKYDVHSTAHQVIQSHYKNRYYVRNTGELKVKLVTLDVLSTVQTPSDCDQATTAAIGAVLASHRSIAAAIVVTTSSGRSAQIVAKYRPRCPIIAVTRYAPVARMLQMWRGILPLYYEESPLPDWHKDIEKRLSFCTKWAVEHGFVRVGDPIVIVTGWRRGSGFTNTMRIVYIEHESMENQH